MAVQPYWYPGTDGSYSELGIEPDELSYDQPPNPWDVCVIGPVTLVGIVEVHVVRERKIDIKKSPGTHGATETDQGYAPAEIEIKQTIWKPSHFQQMQGVWGVLEPEPSKQDATPLDIMHPATAMRGVKSIYIQKIEGPDKGTTPGSKVFTYRCVEWYPKPKAGATNTPKKSIQAFDNDVSGEKASPATPPSSTTPTP